MLVVVEDGDVQRLLKAAFYVEAPGRGDVFQVDAAVRRRDGAHRGDYLVGVLRVQAHRHGVNARKLLEEQSLTLHDGQGGQRAYVAEAQHGGAIGDDGNHISARGVLPDGVRVLGYFPAGLCHAGRVGGGQVVAVFHAHLTLYLYLAAVLAVHGERERVVVHVFHFRSPQG